MSVKASRPDRRSRRGTSGLCAAPLDRAHDGGYVLGRGAAAAADDVDQAGVGELGEQPRHVVRALVVAAELVGQAGIGIGADESVGDARDLGDVGAHLLGAERTVEPDRHRRGVTHRVPERGRRLPDRSRPERSVMVPEIITGTLVPRASMTSAIAAIAALALSVSKIVSISRMSAPPASSSSTCSA